MSVRLLTSGPPVPSEESVPSARFCLGSELDREVAMTYLYPGIPCPVCGGAHTLYLQDETPGAGASYSYVCPRTEVIVICRPVGDPTPRTRAPDGAVPMTWLAD